MRSKYKYINSTSGRRLWYC